MTKAETRGSGLRAVLVATAVAGIVGYAIQLLAPALLLSSEYVSFSVFWSTLFLGGAAISGVQQEISRATHPQPGGDGARTLRAFAVGAALVVALGAIALALVLGDAILPHEPGAAILALVIGLVGYLATSIVTGVFYGLHLWAGVAFAVITDALLRLVLVVTGLLLGWSVAALAVLVAVPFGAAAALAWIFFRRRLMRAMVLDVGMRRLIVQVSGTVVATGASGVMISGLPMLIGVTSPDVPAVDTGALLLAITVTRAPIVIPVIALQSFLIAAVFRGGGLRAGRIVRLVVGVVIVGVGLSAAGWLLGPPVVSLVSGGRFSLSGADAASIVFSATIVAGMCITGPALIALRRHAANTVGWLVAAGLTAGILVMPWQDGRIPLALLGAPAVGLALHIMMLLRARSVPDHEEPRALDSA